VQALRVASSISDAQAAAISESSAKKMSEA